MNGLRAHEDIHRIPYGAFLANYWRSQGRGPMPGPMEVSGTVKARVNHGRWIVGCPAGCGGAVMASRDMHRFICGDCGSQENGGRWYAVAWPAPRMRGEIGVILARRPEANRNWDPTETVRDLERENSARGLEA